MKVAARMYGRRVLCVLAIAITASAIPASLGAVASAAEITTTALLSNVKAAIAQQTGVHVAFAAYSGSSSSITEKIVADVGTVSGTETIFEGTADLAIRVTPSFAYVRGDSSGLTTLFGLTASEANRVGTHWEFWKAGSGQYKNLKSDLTMSSILALLPKVRGTKLSTETSGGTSHYVLSWTTAATSSLPKLTNTLTVSAVGATLPITRTSSASGGTKITSTLSKWGESVVVPTPPVSSTIASSKVSK